MKLHGTGERKPRLVAREAAHPAWSPDGGRLAFISEGDGNIYVTSRDRSDVRRVTGDAGSQPDWSPDGRRLAYSLQDQDICVVDARGPSGRQTCLLDGGGGGDPAWSPDGRSIAFTRYSEVASPPGGMVEGDIYVMSANGEQLRRLTHGGSHDHGPSWSPSGSRVAFASSRGGGSHICVINNDGSGPTCLTTGSIHFYDPEWGT